MSPRREVDAVAQAKTLAPMLQASAAEIEHQRRLPETLMDTMLDAGLFGLLLPRVYGGMEVEPAVFLSVLEEIARHDVDLIFRQRARRQWIRNEHGSLRSSVRDCL